LRTLRNTSIAVAAVVVAMLAIGSLDVKPAQAGLDGAGMYAKYCALCHGSDGSGYAAGRAPAIANPQFLAAASDHFLRNAIEHGRPYTAMPPFGTFYSGPLSFTQEDAIIKHLRTYQTEPQMEFVDDPIDGDGRDARDAYAAKCASCHGARGEGASAPSLNNPSFLPSIFDEHLRHVIENGRAGTPMRAYGGQLADRGLDDMTNLIRDWSTAMPGPPTLVSEPRQPVLNPSGAAPSFSLRNDRYVLADALKAALDSGAKLVLVDARVKSAWRRMHIPGAAIIPYFEDRLDKKTKKIPNDGTWIVVYCASPHQAADVVADGLKALGYANVAVLEEGVIAWKDQRFPVEINEGPPPPQ